MYYKPDTKQVFQTHDDIRSTLLYILFPEVIDDDMLKFHGVFPVVDAPPVVKLPEIAKPKHVELVDGVWTRTYEVVEATEEELEAMKPLVPVSVTRRQARQALHIYGFLDKVPALLDGIEDGMQRGLSKIEWEDATEFVRARPLVVQIGQALGLDEAGLDELFIFAATL